MKLHLYSQEYSLRKELVHDKIYSSLRSGTLISDFMQCGSYHLTSFAGVDLCLVDLILNLYLYTVLPL